MPFVEKPGHRDGEEDNGSEMEARRRRIDGKIGVGKNLVYM